MKRFCLLLLLSLFCILPKAWADPDTVHVGIYINSIHDINFRDKEYTVNLWLWMNYKNAELNFVQNLEVPMAKTWTKAYTTIDTIDGKYYVLMKLQCVMKDSWKIHNFPFDKQTLRFSIENSQFDTSSFIFVVDTAGANHHRFTVSGWQIDSFNVSAGVKEYETAFGDPEAMAPISDYATFRVKMVMERDAWGLFWKLFLGMYVSFLIAMICLFIHADNIDSRLGLSVGSLFTAIGNKYIIDSSLPESSSFTLVDTLHGITLLFIFFIIAISVYVLRLAKSGKMKKAKRTDKFFIWLLGTVYIVFNLLFILLSV